MAAVGVSSLQDRATESGQLSFFQCADHEKNAVIEKTVDDIRKKFGNAAIYPAALVDNALGIQL